MGFSSPKVTYFANIQGLIPVPGPSEIWFVIPEEIDIRLLLATRCRCPTILMAIAIALSFVDRIPEPPRIFGILIPEGKFVRVMEADNVRCTFGIVAAVIQNRSCGIPLSDHPSQFGKFLLCTVAVAVLNTLVLDAVDNH